jgi:DNA-binding LacI/PurR family transcriptional regulator
MNTHGELSGRVTQSAMARQLGVSQALVARALQNDPAVAATTRTRVQAAAARLGYQPNPSARALLTGRTGLVGLWIARAYGSFSSRIIFALEPLVRAHGLDLLIADLGPYGEPVRELASSRWPLEGLLVVDSPWHVESYLRSHPRGAPCVSLGTAVSRKVDAVEMDVTSGARAVVSHIRKLGARRVAYVTPLHPLGQREARMRVYSSVVKPADRILLPQATRRAAREAVAEYLRVRGCPDVFLCHNDDYALGVVRGLRDLGLRVPTDVAVVGCDGLEDTEYLDVPLSTIVLPVDEMCAKAWSYLAERLNGYQGKPRRVNLPTHIEVRSSSLHPTRARARGTASAE